MKKAIIITGAVIALAGAGFLGFGWYLSEPSVTVSTDSYSIKVPKSFKLTDQKDDLRFTFKCLGEEIKIEDITLNCTPELSNELMAHYAYEEDENLEKLEGYPYKGYFISSDIFIKDKKETCLSYIFGTDTNFLTLKCFCSPSKSGVLKKAMDNIAKSAVYTSDFRIATKSGICDYDFASVNTGIKYKCYDGTEEKKINDEKCLFHLHENYEEADDIKKTSFPFIDIDVSESDKGTPAEMADKVFQNKAEKKEKFAVLTRDQKEMFGYKCENVYYEQDMSLEGEAPDIICMDDYYFSNDTGLYRIFAAYRKDYDENDIKEMLDGITIKDIK